MVQWICIVSYVSKLFYPKLITCELIGFDLFSDVPALLSLPHFLYADSSYGKAVEGLKPSVEDHLTYVELEPVSVIFFLNSKIILIVIFLKNTGTPLTGHKRFQVNFIVRPIAKDDDYIGFTENWPRVVLPAVWLDEVIIFFLLIMCGCDKTSCFRGWNCLKST